MPHQEESGIEFTGNVLMFLFVFIIIFGVGIVFSITHHTLCVRKNLPEQTVFPKTSLEETLGRNPSYDILACKR
ncbi:MAG: hypothetical protein U0516_04665 [Candidatus Saccharibacteria bacterium]